jgi:hypothetical protein
MAHSALSTFTAQQPRWQSLRWTFDSLRSSLPESVAKEALTHGFNELDGLYAAIAAGHTNPYAVRILYGNSGLIPTYAAHARSLTRRRGMTAETAALEHIRREAKALHTELFPNM